MSPPPPIITKVYKPPIITKVKALAKTSDDSYYKEFPILCTIGGEIIMVVKLILTEIFFFKILKFFL